jgi:ABC-type phosphate transport system substrate-binding protein
VENLSFTELRKIFMGERSRWPNGHRIVVTMMEAGNLEREIVLRDVYRMDESNYRELFLKGTYTGDIPVSPKTLSSPAIVLKFIFNAPGAIGYLRASEVDNSVKVVSIDRRLPEDLGYKLQIEAADK